MRPARLALAAILLGVAAQPPAPAVAAEGTAKWFVVRNPGSFQCWTARLIRASGQYAAGKNLIAGGPYETKEAAEEWLATLEERGTCRSE